MQPLLPTRPDYNGPQLFILHVLHDQFAISDLGAIRDKRDNRPEGERVICTIPNKILRI